MEEIALFISGYQDYVDGYIDKTLSDRVGFIYERNKEALEGTPEGNYILELMKPRKARDWLQDEKAYDVKLIDLKDELSIRTYNCLRNDNIIFVGQLIQKTEADMLRTPNFSMKSLNELKELLHGHGLKFGMDIDYVIPGERKK